MLGGAVGIIVFFNVFRKKILEKEAKLRAMELDKQLEVFRSVIEAEERQKEDIAARLHNGIIPEISAVERSIDKNIKDFGTSDFDLQRLKNDLGFIEQIGREIRGVSHNLANPTLLALGLLKALGEYVDRIGETTSSGSKFENESNFYEDLPFSMSDQQNIYQICLELLNNLYKHAKYTHLRVLVKDTNDALTICFFHNGHGITNEQIEKLTNTSNGLGLRSLKSRSSMLKASFNYIEEAGKSRVLLTIPFKR